MMEMRDACAGETCDMQSKAVFVAGVRGRQEVINGTTLCDQWCDRDDRE